MPLGAALIPLVVTALFGLGGDVATARVVERLPGKTIGAAFGRQSEQRRLVVQVVASGCRGLSVGSGVITGDGRVLTNRHVVAGADYAEVRRGDGTRIGARVEAVGADIDLATLWVGPAAGRAPMPIGRLDPGEQLTIVGYPHGRPYTATTGPVTARYHFDEVGMRADAAFVDATVDLGSSGGAAFDRQGRIVGIVFGREQRTGLAAVIDGDVASGFLAGSYPFGDPTACDGERG